MANFVLQNTDVDVSSSTTITDSLKYSGAQLTKTNISNGDTVTSAFSSIETKVTSLDSSVTTNTTDIATNTASAATNATSISNMSTATVDKSGSMAQTTVDMAAANDVDDMLDAIVAYYDAKIAAISTSASGTSLGDVAATYSDLIVDHVSSGLSVSSTAGLVATLASGVIYIDGAKVTVASDSDTLTASKDNYVNIKADGTHSVQVVTVDASAPTTPTGEINVWKFTTGGSTITVQTDKRSYNAFSAAALSSSVVGTIGKLSKFTAANIVGDSVVTESSSKIGINSTAPDKTLEINSSDGNNLRLTYNDADGSATNYTDFTLSSSGDLSITPSGGDASIVATTSIDLKSPQVDIGENDASDVTLNFLGSTNDMAVVYDESAKTLAFDTSDLFLDAANARLGIGVTSLTSPAGIAKYLKIEDASSAGIILNDTGGTEWSIYSADSSLYIHASSGGSVIGSKVTLLEDGRFGIGKTPGTGNVLDVLMGSSGKYALFVDDTYYSASVTGGADRLNQIGASDGHASSKSITLGVRGTSDGTGSTTRGAVADSYIFSNSHANGINIISQVGAASQDDYIRFYAGIDATDTAQMFITGRTAGSVIKGDIGVGTESPRAKLHIAQTSASGARPCLELEQDDVDDSFIEFDGTSAADSTKSISSSTAETAAKFGAVRISINGTDKWIRVYDSAV